MVLFSLLTHKDSFLVSSSSPVILTVDNKPMFEGTFVLATLSQKSDTQASNRQETTQSHSRVHHTPSANSRGKNGPARETGSTSNAQGRCDEDDRRRISEEICNVSMDGIRDRGGETKALLVVLSRL